MRLGAVFIAFCMVVIAASAGATAYFGFGFAGAQSLILALAVLTALGLYNTFATRLAVRAALGNQLGDLSRGSADIARQTAELGRRVSTIENRVAAMQARIRTGPDPLAAEIGELGTLVRQLAETVAGHEARLDDVPAVPAQQPAPPTTTTEAAPVETAPPAIARPETARSAAAVPMPAPTAASPAQASVAGAAPVTAFGEDVVAAPVAPLASVRPPVAPPEPVLAPPMPAAATTELRASEAARIADIKSAIEANRLDLYLQPIVTLPQRKVRYYEALSRLRTEAGPVLAAAEFMDLAQRAGMAATIDNLVVFRCVQVVRRLLLKNRDIGLFCNLSDSALTDAAAFQQLLDFLQANRAIAPSIMLEFKQSAIRAAGPIELESLSALADCGFRFSLDNIADLNFEPRELAARGFRFVKIAGSLLVDPKLSSADIHPGDLPDLLGRFGIELIAERIETEAMVVDLLDYDVRFGQGYLFSPPRPVRAEALQGIADRGDLIAAASGPGGEAPVAAARPAAEPSAVARTGGIAQLVRGATGRI